MKKILTNSKFKDILAILFYIIFYLIVIYIITKNGKYLLASNVDFVSQHYLFPDYIRNLFYENHQILPSFAFNLGAC